MENPQTTRPKAHCPACDDIYHSQADKESVFERGVCTNCRETGGVCERCMVGNCVTHGKSAS